MVTNVEPCELPPTPNMRAFTVTTPVGCGDQRRLCLLVPDYLALRANVKELQAWIADAKANCGEVE